MKFRSWYILIIVASCSFEREIVTDIDNYFSIDSLIENQIKALSSLSVKLDKTVAMDDVNESRTLTPNEKEWGIELDILKSINLNKPRYVGVFDVKVDKNKKTYLLKKGEKVPIKEVIIDFEGAKIKRISGRILDDNSAIIYTLERNIIIRFNNEKIEDYSIEGYQKMILKDTVRFKIYGKIIY